jgi:hypothetical protein
MSSSDVARIMRCAGSHWRARCASHAVYATRVCRMYALTNILGFVSRSSTIGCSTVKLQNLVTGSLAVVWLCILAPSPQRYFAELNQAMCDYE